MKQFKLNFKSIVQTEARWLLTLIAILTLGVGQMWADNGDFYNMYIAYSFEGAGGAIDGDDNNTGVTVDAGTLTSGSLTLTGVYLKCWDDWGENFKSSGGQLCYTNKGGSTQYISCTRSGKSGNNYEYQNSNPGVTLASYNQASGSFEFHCWGQTWGWGDRYFPKSSGHYVLKYKIAPPAVSEGNDFTVTPSNLISGTGTSSDPFIIAYGETTTFKVTATKHHTDANSKLKVSWNNGSTWSTGSLATTTELTSSSFTPDGTKRNITIKVKFNNSTASLDGEVSSRTIHYIQQTPGLTVAAGDNGKVRKSTGDSWATSALISPVAASTAYNIYANPDSYYDFDEWTTSDGTHSSFANSKSASTTVTLSAGYSAVTTVTANFKEHPYTITIVGGTASSTTAGISTTKGTATVSVPFGKRFTGWTVPGSNFTLTDGTTTSSTTIKFNATAAGTVTANFAQNYAFIEGRFHVWTLERTGAWINTKDDGDCWSTSSTNIRFEYDETNHRFYRHTYATPKELTTQIASNTPYFHIRTSTSGNSLSGGSSYYPASNTPLATADEEKSVGTTGSNNFYFNNSSDQSGYVVLYFNGTKVWYSLEQRLKYDGNGSTSGSVASTYHARSSSATAAANGFSKTGHDFTGWKTGPSSGTSYAVGATVPISSSDVTLYAQWSPSTYTVTYDPASPTNFAYSTKPTSGTYNTSVSVTITPNLNYKITGVTAKRTGSSTSVSVSHTAATNVWTFTQPAYGVTLTTTAASYALTATASADSYENKTFALGYTSTYTPEGTKGTNWFVNYVCTSKPEGATCTINQSTGVATVSKDGSYTFKAQFRTASGGGGTLLAESSDVTSAMRTIPDRSGLTIGHARYNTTYMSGNGASATPYFIYYKNRTSYGKLNLTATLPAALLTGESLYYSVNGSEIGTVTVVGTSASVTMDLPNKTAGDKRSTTIKFYSKLDGQAASDAKKASATVYYHVCANPVVTVSATYNDSPIAGEIPQNATIVVSASATNISGTPTFQYKKGSGSYSSTTEYTLEAAGATTMYAKTTALGDTWEGSLNVTTYAANAVTYVTSKTDMYGDVATTSTSRLFKSSGEEHTAADIDGYTFTGWTCSNSNVQVRDNGSTWKSTSSNATVYVKATAAGGTLTASYTENKRIYFDNSKAKWTGDIYVYFFSGDAWYNDYNGTDKNGPGVVPRLASRIGYGQMTRIGSSDVYYYEYGALSFTRVAFSVGNQYNYDMLYNTKGAWRTDFSSCNPCYVAPETSDQTKYNTGGSGKSGDNKPTYYYNNGYWRRYMPAKSGYTLHFADQEVAFLPEDPSVDAENFKVTVLRAAGTTYPIYVNNSCMSKTWKNASAITKDNCSNLTLTQTSGICNFTTTAVGDYVFRLSTANGQVKLTVEYPLSTGDYQVYYSDNTGNNNNYSNYIRKNSSGSTKQDKVSFFIKKNASPTFQIKRCTGFSGSTPTWENVGSATAISVAKDSVYNLIFQQNGTGTTISKVGQEFYSGNYYIRTDGAAGGWGNYLSNPDNKMKHTDKASALAAGYNYYYLRWIGDASGNSTANVKFCIATDYNNCVSQEHGNDPKDGSLSGGQALTGKGANVRFTYHPGTNTTTRTCVGGSAHDSQYLVINGTNLETSGGASWAGRTKMTDMNDWIYTYELKAANDATITLESHYNDKYVTILPTKKVLEVGDALYYDLRIVYDYKTNEVVAAYIPSTVSSDLTIDVDIMFIRQAKDNHESAPTTTLTLSDGAKITGDPKTLYGAIKFEKDYVRAEGSYSGLVTSRPERSTYWISFPFDVRIKDIFGLGDYTETWIIQRYRGDSRASKGWFLDTKTFWEYVMDENYVMKAGQGYVLSIDCEAIQWPNNQTTQYLYFPSKDKISDITSVLPSASMNVPEHTCSITSPADRTVKDSHWNVIGIPGFADAWGRATEDVSVIGGNLKYFYTWAPSTNTLSTTSTRKYNFKFMHSYMVQYYGNIDWSASEPAAIVAKRSSGTLQEEVEFCIDLMKDSIKEDNAFVTLMDNNRATTDFDMNTDLVKMLNAKNANIYTIINSDIQAAANCLPMTEQTTIVPVGVQIATNGTYTFTMPDGTNGVSVTLVDNEANTRTNLALTDYTVNLTAGTHDGRFLLEIAPIQQTPTDIDLINGENGEKGVRKMLIDQQMYIIRDGKIYDARGARVQ